MRKEYEMSDEDLKELMEACKPVPYLVANGTEPMSPQESANRAWERLGDKMGFQFMTVRPVEGKGDKFFTAEPKE